LKEGSCWIADVDTENALVDAHDRATMMATKEEDDNIFLLMTMDYVKMDGCVD
jgi:hypothetical protein